MGAQVAGDPSRYVCPVCHFAGLSKPAVTGGIGSGEICPCCGFGFNGPVGKDQFRAWLKDWVQGGMRWAGEQPPPGWDAFQRNSLGLQSLEEVELSHAGDPGSSRTRAISVPGGDRLIIRPQPLVWVLAGLTFGLFAVIEAGIGVELLLEGKLVGVAILTVAAVLIGLIYIGVGGHLWVDAENIGSTVPFKRWIVRRAEIAKMRLGRRVGKTGTNCDFMRADGTIACTTETLLWGRSRLQMLAQFLGVPLTELKQRA